MANAVNPYGDGRGVREDCEGVCNTFRHSHELRDDTPMKKLVQWMDRIFYSRYADRWDERLFREMILARLTPNSIVLDLGAGRGRVAEMGFRGKCAFVAGVDPDPSVMSNPLLDEAKQLTPPEFRIPYPDNRFDVVFLRQRS